MKEKVDLDNIEELFSLGWIVSTLFLEEPPNFLSQQMVHGELELPVPQRSNGMLRQGMSKLQAFTQAQLGRDATELHEELRQEFAALFIGPQPRAFHPYESVYRDNLKIGGETFRGLLMGESVDRVRTFWAEAGVQSIHRVNYPPDHFGLELGFVAYLGREFLESGQTRWLSLAQRFLQEHLLVWGPLYCADLTSVDEANFYKPVAQLANGLIETIAQQIIEMNHYEGDSYNHRETGR